MKIKQWASEDRDRINNTNLILRELRLKLTGRKPEWLSSEKSEQYKKERKAFKETQVPFSKSLI